MSGANSDRSEKMPSFSLAWYIKLSLSRALAAWHRASRALLPETLMRLLMFSKWSFQTALVPLGVSWSQVLVCGLWVVLACKAVPSCSVLPPFPTLSWVGKSICVTTWPVLTRSVILRKQKQVRTKASFQGGYFPNFLHKETAQILQVAQAIRNRRGKQGWQVLCK